MSAAKDHDDGKRPVAIPLMGQHRQLAAWAGSIVTSSERTTHASRGV